ncbi:hypothetical protein KIW84_054847 [Lathyrus oleraceus]|uniref:Cytochrome b/b6 N-terminal region profile domain-containing protein n=1 Tax=Pisum sativum TaxID=3888 RepID=A0A9D4WYT7_PEA|nr:hypothetical protein KIW84_054847 [Pisum sativum]
MRDKLRYKLSKLPRNSSFARVRNRCISTGRPRSVYEFFRISRIVFSWISISRSFDGHKEIVLVATAKPIKQGLAPQLVHKQGNKMRVLGRRESGKNPSDSVTEQSSDSSVTQDDPTPSTLASFAVYPLHPSEVEERKAMHYTPHVDLAFNSVEHVMRDVEGGWLLRYMHANGASMFLIVVHLHIFRGLYHASYSSPREFVRCLGVVIFLLMIVTAFTGYVPPWGQMSFGELQETFFHGMASLGQAHIGWYALSIGDFPEGLQGGYALLRWDVGRGDGSLSRYASRTRSPTGTEIGPATGGALPGLKNSSGLNLTYRYW